MRAEPDFADDARFRLDELRSAAPIALELKLAYGGRSVVANGWCDEEVAALEVPRADGGGEDLMMFATALLAHRVAAYVELGPRPQIAADGTLATARSDLDDPMRRDDAHAGLGDEVRAAIVRPEALRWRLRLSDRATGGASYAQALEVYDAPGHGIWLVLQQPGGNQDAVVLVPVDSTIVWRGLTTMLPTVEELEAMRPE